MSQPPCLSAADTLAALRWRYAVKKFDAQRKISSAEWQALEQALALSPSSYGLQPWHFVVVKSPEQRLKLLAASMNQHQVVDSSHLVVFAARTDILDADVSRWIERIAEVQKLTKADLEPMRAVISGDLVTGMRHEIAGEWAKRQVYLALGGFLTTAAVMGIDVCPMEGFDPKRYDEILGLRKLGYATTVIATVGYRSADDSHATKSKVRYPTDEVVISV